MGPRWHWIALSKQSFVSLRAVPLKMKKALTRYVRVRVPRPRSDEAWRGGGDRDVDAARGY